MSMTAQFVRIARSLRRHTLSDDSVFLPFLRQVWERGVVMRTAKIGVPVRVGLFGEFRLDASVVFGNVAYESWGGLHNSGFSAWIDTCRGASDVMDIGAHIGLYSLPAACVVAPGGRVHAFEPGETNRCFLERHVKYNHFENIIVSDYLVGDSDVNDVSFYEDTGVNGINSVVRERMTNKPSSERLQETRKRQCTIDTYCRTYSVVPQVVKIDVEGAEEAVLRGGKETWHRARPDIFLSVHPKHLESLGSSTHGLLTLIHELAYDVFDMNGYEVHELGAQEYRLVARRHV